MFINNIFSIMAEPHTSKNLVLWTEFFTLDQPNKSYGSKTQKQTKLAKSFHASLFHESKDVKIGSFPPQSSNLTFPKTNLSMIQDEDGNFNSREMKPGMPFDNFDLPKTLLEDKNESIF